MNVLTPPRDVSAAPTAKAHYQDVHSDDVTELAFHSTRPELLLSGSTDGLVSVYDTRIADEDEVTIQTFNHGASVHHAAFLAPSSEVFALSHDERFALYDVAEETVGGDATHDFGDLRSVLGCQYVANVTPKMDGVGAVMGAGSQEYVCSPAKPFMRELILLYANNLTASRCFSCSSWPKTPSRNGHSTQRIVLACRAPTERKLFAPFASLTKSKSYLRRAKTAASEDGGQVIEKENSMHARSFDLRPINHRGYTLVIHFAALL